MTKTPLYKYVGSNGVIITPVDLGFPHDDMLRLSADIGNVLTDGETETCVIDIVPEDEDKWSEIPYQMSPEDENALEVK